MKNAIEVRGLTKKYNNGFKLDKIDIEIPSGTIVGLIGENGAGKTTLIKLLLGIVKKDQGNIKIFNKDFYNFEQSIKKDIGVVLDNTFFPEVLNANDINNVMADIFENWDSELFYKYLDEFKLSNDKNIKTMSKGNKKKLEIATALAHHPKLLILDEPTSGLDPIVRNEILDIFLNFIQQEDHTILLSTHITSDLENIADKIIFLDNGKKVLDESRDDIMDCYGILKCDVDYFSKIDKTDIIGYKKNKYNYEMLVTNKSAMIKKYKECVIENITLDELMLLIIKGEK